MPDVTEIAEIAADGVADGIHIVGEEALAMEQAVRGFDGARLGFLGLGLIIGGAIGGLVGFKVAYSKAEQKHAEIAAEEIAAMRQHYTDKATAVDLVMEKGNLEALVKEKGYSSADDTKPPMAVSAPESVLRTAQDVADEEMGDPPDNEPEEPEVHNVFRDAEVQDEWDYEKEKRSRSPLRPYIIHIDERHDGYDQVTYTYYEEDDVLANEREDVIGQPERMALIGDESHFSKFGHGSGDANVLYIRNDKLEMDIELLRSPNSYAEEVHGFVPEPEIRHSIHRVRERFDDD